ncbi:hypothetical protein NOCARDAX2BIS_380167 [Nocardioides sp. AX2bis]|nr:hypothetical protein NOCARDAX2BIS_380167 [Nocardioides sp. AX2bis]
MVAHWSPSVAGGSLPPPSEARSIARPSTTVPQSRCLVRP